MFLLVNVVKNVYFQYMLLMGMFEVLRKEKCNEPSGYVY